MKRSRRVSDVHAIANRRLGPAPMYDTHTLSRCVDVETEVDGLRGLLDRRRNFGTVTVNDMWIAALLRIVRDLCRNDRELVGLVRRAGAFGRAGKRGAK